MSLIKPIFKLKKIISDNSDKIIYKNLSINPNSISYLKENPHLINWEGLSQNPDLSYAIPLLEKYPDKISWKYISFNSNLSHLMHILKTVFQQNPEKINWLFLSSNPCIFEIDPNQMKIELTKKAKNIDYI